jgi:hypothetical protein
MRADHEKCEAERDRLAMELERMAGAASELATLAVQIESCDRQIKRINPISGQVLGYIRPVLSGAAPAIASVFQDAVVIDAFVAAAAVLSQPLPPLPSSPPAKLRAV